MLELEGCILIYDDPCYNGAGPKSNNEVNLAMAKKHVPVRTCVACGTSRPKRELIRIVRTPEGQVELDLTGKKPGRGAYLCPRAECWDLKVAIPRLQRSLRATIDETARASLEAYAQSLHGANAPQPATVEETS